MNFKSSELNYIKNPFDQGYNNMYTNVFGAFRFISDYLGIESFKQVMRVVKYFQDNGSILDNSSNPVAYVGVHKDDFIDIRTHYANKWPKQKTTYNTAINCTNMGLITVPITRVYHFKQMKVNNDYILYDVMSKDQYILKNSMSNIVLDFNTNKAQYYNQQFDMTDILEFKIIDVDIPFDTDNTFRFVCPIACVLSNFKFMHVLKHLFTPISEDYNDILYKIQSNLINVADGFIINYYQDFQYYNVPPQLELVIQNALNQPIIIQMVLDVGNITSTMVFKPSVQTQIIDNILQQSKNKNVNIQLTLRDAASKKTLCVSQYQDTFDDDYYYNKESTSLRNPYRFKNLLQYRITFHIKQMKPVSNYKF